MRYLYLALAAAGFILLILFCFTLFFGFWAYKYKRLFFPKIALLMLSMFEWPVKAVLGKINVDKIIVDLTNKVYEKSFDKTKDEEKIVFLPQCLRHKECKAPLTPKGIECMYCGKCGIGEFKKKADNVGIRTFIVPGSSFVKRALAEYKPKAVLGVGCNIEIKEGMKMAANEGYVPQSVRLKNDGCVGTKIEWNDVEKRLGI